MEKTEDFIKYVTEQLVRFFSTSKQQRRTNKLVKENWAAKWFGLIPFSLRLWLKTKNKRSAKKR